MWLGCFLSPPNIATVIALFPRLVASVTVRNAGRWTVPAWSWPGGGTGEELLSFCPLLFLEGFPPGFTTGWSLGPPTTFQIFPNSLRGGSSTPGADSPASGGRLGGAGLAVPRAQHSSVLSPFTGFEVSLSKIELWTWSSKIPDTVDFSFAAPYAWTLSGLQLFGCLTRISKRC